MLGLPVLTPPSKARWAFVALVLVAIVVRVALLVAL